MSSALSKNMRNETTLNYNLTLLWRGSAAARLLGLRVRITPGAWMFVCCVCCQVEVSATGRFLVQRSPTGCVVSHVVGQKEAGRRKKEELFLDWRDMCLWKLCGKEVIGGVAENKKEELLRMQSKLNSAGMCNLYSFVMLWTKKWKGLHLPQVDQKYLHFNPQISPTRITWKTWNGSGIKSQVKYLCELY